MVKSTNYEAPHDVISCVHFLLLSWD